MGQKVKDTKLIYDNVTKLRYVLDDILLEKWFPFIKEPAHF